MSYLLGIDLGSSSVKVSLVDAGSGECKASAHYPETEAPIKALQPGWAEQRPDDWWQYFKRALEKLRIKNEVLRIDEVAAVGISYQMHGLVCLDKDLRPLRDAIIWCDSRGVPYGEHAPLPGNFTAAKLAWVKEHEPELFVRIKYIMLPGDYLAMRLTGTPSTTACGLSEMMLWDFQSEKLKVKREKLDGRDGISEKMMEYFGIPQSIIPPLVPTFGEQGRVTESVAKELGIKAGIPVSYRAGDQPNNALSLRVLHPGEVASTAGTSGVVYGVMDNFEFRAKGCEHLVPKVECGESNSNFEDHDSNSSFKIQNSKLINAFLHVNGNIGLMHCTNGCGILNSWLRRNVTADLSYDEMNALAATAPVGSESVSIIPFGNGAERVLGNKDIGASIHGLNFNRHTRAHLLRAAQEGIAFAFMYGMEQMKIENGKLKKENSADATNNSQLSTLNSQFTTPLADGRYWSLDNQWSNGYHGSLCALLPGG